MQSYIDAPSKSLIISWNIHLNNKKITQNTLFIKTNFEVYQNFSNFFTVGNHFTECDKTFFFKKKIKYLLNIFERWTTRHGMNLSFLVYLSSSKFYVKHYFVTKITEINSRLRYKEFHFGLLTKVWTVSSHEKPGSNFTQVDYCFFNEQKVWIHESKNVNIFAEEYFLWFLLCKSHYTWNFDEKVYVRMLPFQVVHLNVLSVVFTLPTAKYRRCQFNLLIVFKIWHHLPVQTKVTYEGKLLNIQLGETYFRPQIFVVMLR